MCHLTEMKQNTIHFLHFTQLTSQNASLTTVNANFKWMEIAIFINKWPHTSTFIENVILYIITFSQLNKLLWLLNIYNTLNILKPSSNWSLFKLIISDQTLIKLKWFFSYICAFEWANVSQCFWTVFFYFKVFWVKNAKIDFLRKKRFWE